MDQAHQAEKQGGPGAEIHDIYKSWSESIQAVPIPISNSVWKNCNAPVFHGFLCVLENLLCDSEKELKGASLY